MSSTPQYLSLTDDNQILADATIRSAPHRPSIHPDLHVEAGHLRVGTGTRLVDAVLDLTAAEPETHLRVTLPAGDGEFSTGFGNAATTYRPAPPEPAALPPALFDLRRDRRCGATPTLFRNRSGESSVRSRRSGAASWPTPRS